MMAVCGNPAPQRQRLMTVSDEVKKDHPPSLVSPRQTSREH